MPKKGITSEEYRRWHSSPKMRKERQQRVEDRRREQDKAGNGDREKGKAALKGKELDHRRTHAKKKLPKTYKVVSKDTNRSRKGAQPKRKGKA